MTTVDLKLEMHEAIALGMVVSDQVQRLKANISAGKLSGESQTVLASLEPAFNKLGAAVAAAAILEEVKNGEFQSDGIELS